MTTALCSFAEKKAEKAENLRSFSGIKLLYIRQKIESILSLIGRNGIFDQYTKHDITHIDEMLRIVEWLIPDFTKEKMSTADWLMLVLSIYFHDMGMIVTTQEYENRGNNTTYQEFKESITHEKEIRKKLDYLGENTDRFIFQEYVRANHAARIKKWIIGEYDKLNQTEWKNIVDEINDMLGHLGTMFRRDLALICESHHMNDLDDFIKYKTRARYGNSDDEVVNLHYIAVILRTADLLHITSDRTPSIQFKIINPSDPKSIIEWQKQMAVKAVQPQMPRDENGNINQDLPRDTIEITAYFEKPDQAEAFFGLSSYIIYMRQEIQKSYEWIQTSIKQEATGSFLFPWRKVDDQNIETLGFEPRQLQFTVDESSILKMLVGHTLYNDSSVVIRELVQNAIDAVKLQYCIEKGASIIPDFVSTGEVRIKWDEEGKCLIVSDNGTGMTINEVESFLLRVGTSKYRSDTFRKKYPSFSAISRFGIGILTCFLIADDVDITTCSEAEETANIVSLRNLNGKYLIKKVSKGSLDSFISKHGTSIALYVRHDVDINNILNDAKKWIVFPNCKVVLYSDSGAVDIGYMTPRDALVKYITNNGYAVDNTTIKVEEKSVDGIILAYGLVYDQYLHEWNFLTIGHKFRPRSDVYSPIGTCIEGIRVDSRTPGFQGNVIVSVANTRNRSQLLTNVARSDVEDNEEKRAFLSSIYQIYSDHIQSEIESLVQKGYSLSWAATESYYLLWPLISDYDRARNPHSQPQDIQALHDEIDKINSIIIENNDKRELVSAHEVAQMNSINVVESEMITAAESLFRQVNSDTSLSRLIGVIQPKITLPADSPLFCNYNSQNILHQHALKNKEVVSIEVLKEERRVNLKYSLSKDRWSLFHITARLGKGRTNWAYIPMSETEINGLSEECGVETATGIYFSYDNNTTQYLKSLLEQFDYNNEEEDRVLAEYVVSLFCNELIVSYATTQGYGDQIDALLNGFFERNGNVRTNTLFRSLWKRVDKEELFSKLIELHPSIYRPNDWSRSDKE